MWVLVIVVILVIAGVAIVASGRGSGLEELPPRGHDMEEFVSPDRLLGADDVRRVKFNLAIRGYRMSEVDALLARVAQQLDTVVGGPVEPVDTHNPEEPPAGTAPQDEAPRDGDS